MSKEEAEFDDKASTSYRRQVKIAVTFYAIIEALALAILIYKFTR
jgi:hypothetical protein